MRGKNTRYHAYFFKNASNKPIPEIELIIQAFSITTWNNYT